MTFIALLVYGKEKESGKGRTGMSYASGEIPVSRDLSEEKASQMCHGSLWLYIKVVSDRPNRWDVHVRTPYSKDLARKRQGSKQGNSVRCGD